MDWSTNNPANRDLMEKKDTPEDEAKSFIRRLLLVHSEAMARQCDRGHISEETFRDVVLKLDRVDTWLEKATVQDTP